jgi:hypothetical protein
VSWVAEALLGLGGRRSSKLDRGRSSPVCGAGEEHHMYSHCPIHPHTPQYRMFCPLTATGWLVIATMLADFDACLVLTKFKERTGKMIKCMTGI